MDEDRSHAATPPAMILAAPPVAAGASERASGRAGPVSERMAPGLRETGISQLTVGSAVSCHLRVGGRIPSDWVWRGRDRRVCDLGGRAREGGSEGAREGGREGVRQSDRR